MKQDFLDSVKEIIDYLLPELTPAEMSLYFYLFRRSYLEHGGGEVRVGKRTIAARYGKGMRGRQTNFGHITKLLAQLIEKGCIQSGDTNREGTLYNVRLPEEIPLVGEKIRNLMPQRSQDDYFSDPKKRAELFERDKWICQYCGEKVTAKNATLDHYIPQCKGGTGTKENLKLCCLVCNGIKSGRTYEEAAPFILKKIQQHKIQLASSSADQRAFPDSGVA